ncbi:MAG: hypothetical protein R6W91_00945 [Thermoplasmata archaeon]
MVLYRNHREYGRQHAGQELGLLKSWLSGQSGNESLRAWLGSIYA